MKLILKLLFGQVVRHPARFLFTLLAVVASAGVVIWVVSGYEALVSQFDEFSEEYLGRYQLVIAPEQAPVGTSPPLSPLPLSVIQTLAGDSDVEAIDSELHVQIWLEKPEAPGKSTAEEHPQRTRRGGGGPPPGERPSGGPGGRAQRGRGNPLGLIPALSPTLVGTTATEPPYPILEGRWIKADATGEAAISRGSAQDFQVKVGDTLQVRNDHHRTTVTVVGIVEQVGTNRFGARGPDPSRGPATAALYVSVPLAEEMRPSPEAASIGQILLKPGTDANQFRVRWAEHLRQSQPPLVFLAADDVEADLDTSRSASGARNQAYSATGIALLAALFIIFTALSMGVHERTRQFATLRAVALTPRQIGSLIALESLLLGAVGWLGGLAAGWGLLQFMRQVQPALFNEPVALGPWCLGLSAACAFGGALIAAIFPAWSAMRVSPLEAMSGPATPLSLKLVPWLTLAGVLLILINPLLVFAWPMKEESRYPIYVAVGCSTMAVGFILIAPAVIRIVEWLLGPLVARLLGLSPRLLAAELSSNLWRTVGTCIALTLGLGLFVSTQIWGYSMLEPFQPGKWVPDLLVSFRQTKLQDDVFAEVAAVPGMKSETCLPLAVEQALLTEDLTNAAALRTVARQDNVILIGLDPGRGLAASDPLLKFRWVAGDPKSAAAAMAAGRACVVPDHFAREANLKLGSHFSVIPPDNPQQPVEYTIAGIVEMPGWHWMTKFSGLRRRHGRAGAIVFADFATVRQDFGLTGISFFWSALQPGADMDALGRGLQAIARQHLGEKQPVNYQGTWKMGSIDVGDDLRLSTPGAVESVLARRADGMIWGMSQLPLVTLAIAGIGVLNTVLASIRARMWNIGVMRAVGLTPFALARLILAEGLLTGFVACWLSLAFGILAGWCGAGISQYVSFFGGLNPSLVIPWQPLSWGIGLTLLLCLLASLWPAWRIARTDLLTLLQSGRASM